MTRNLNHRVEVVFPIESAEHVRYLRDHVLDLYLKDNARAWWMQADGKYKREHLSDADERIDIQEWLMNRSRKNQ
jgi:polyphosphate kinase